MDLQKAFGINAEKESEGVWIRLDETSRIRVARAGNPQFKAYFERLQKQNALGTRKELPEALKQELLIKATARCVLKEWEGLSNNGVPLGPYTEELGIQLLTELEVFRNLVFATAMDLQLFQDDEEEAEEKNS